MMRIGAFRMHRQRLAQDAFAVGITALLAIEIGEVDVRRNERRLHADGALVIGFGCCAIAEPHLQGPRFSHDSARSALKAWTSRYSATARSNTARCSAIERHRGSRVRQGVHRFEAHGPDRIAQQRPARLPAALGLPADQQRDGRPAHQGSGSCNDRSTTSVAGGCRDSRGGSMPWRGRWPGKSDRR